MVSFLLLIVQRQNVNTQGAEVYILGVQESYPLDTESSFLQGCSSPRNVEGGPGRIRCLGIVCKASFWSAPANSTASLISTLGSDVLLLNFSFQ